MKHFAPKHLWSCFTSGLMWSVTYLAAVEVVHHYTSAAVALMASYPIKIAWGFVHTWVNRWRGHREAHLSISFEGGAAE